MYIKGNLVTLLLLVLRCSSYKDNGNQTGPLVYLAIIARNSEHLLYNYLGYIERLSYPKEKIIVG